MKSKNVQIVNASYTLEQFEDGTLGVHLATGDIKGQDKRFYGGYMTVTPDTDSPFGKGYVRVTLEGHSKYECGKETISTPLIFEEDIAEAKLKEEARELLKSQVGSLKGTLKQVFDKDKDIIDFLNEVMKEYKPAKTCRTLADLFE
jgi:hypothetical protein